MRPATDFNPSEDAAALRKAMKGFGTDEDKIIEILCARPNAQRQQISQVFNGEFGRDLIKDLKSELGGKFEDVIIGLMMPPFDYMCHQLFKAMDGVGTDEAALIEILCPRTRDEVLLSSSYSMATLATPYVLQIMYQALYCRVGSFSLIIVT